MKQKTFRLVVGVATGAAAIANAVVAYIQPAYSGAIAAGIDIVLGATVEVCSLFVKEE